MANVAFIKTGLTGGTATDLDGIPVASITNQDIAFVDLSGVRYNYQYDSSSSAAESSPDVILPDDNGGNGRWLIKLPYILDEDDMASDSAVKAPSQQSSKAYIDGKTLYNAYVMVSDTKSSGTEGDSVAAGTWNTRAITTEDQDTDNIASISGNQLTLAAGTYRCLITATAFAVGRHKSRLYNNTDAAVELYSLSSYAYSLHLVETPAVLTGRFTIAAQKVFDIEHYCESGSGNSRLGSAVVQGNEIYMTAEFWRES